jgi:hypothetical protein
MIFITGYAYVLSQPLPPAKKILPFRLEGNFDAVEDLKEYLLDDFERKATDWIAVGTSPLGITAARTILYPTSIGKKEATQTNNQTNQPQPQQSSRQIYGTPPNHGKYCIGVKTYFAEKGFDRVEIIPPHPWIIKGKLREVRVWVLGRRFAHTLYAKLMDYKGNIHLVKLGKLNFFGWKDMKVIVPGYVPQSIRFGFLDKNIKLLSLVIVSDLRDSAGVYYVYFDNLRIIVDESDFAYPGADIRDNW